MDNVEPNQTRKTWSMSNGIQNISKLQEGDRCSKFFYAQFAARKAHNTLRKVVIPEGSEITDQRQVQQYAVEYYRDLLNKETHIPVPHLTSSHKLSEGAKSGLCVEQFNTSFIALIPKNTNASSLDQFRPISLCDMVYKLITKIFASRL
ncbi:hypothetical protein QJS10_CPB11g00910 [Acorus calamus]|uniref:Uncharacterized protein n=1 Tax=Acorus calamus TaxID=4465 RepID=A0AAV9DR30_ACOCL|nr:hypothetical protein QJS10_CPB11g00910 [Acorus calamus]